MSKGKTTGTLILGLMALSAFFAAASASGRSLPSHAQSMPAAPDIALGMFRQSPLPQSQNALSTAVLYVSPSSPVAAATVNLTATKLAISLEDGAVNRYFSDNRSLSMISGSRIPNLDLSARLTGPNLQKYISPVEAFVTRPTVDYNDFAKKFAQFGAPGAIATLVPEPSTWAMTIMGASLLLSVHRFRRKQS